MARAMIKNSGNRDDYGIIHKPLIIVADDKDNTYLGELTTNRYESKGIFNEYGNYGSKYSGYSIWNEYGSYGSQFSAYSPFNEFASHPPLLVDANENILARITINNYFADGIHPNDLYGLAEYLGL